MNLQFEFRMEELLYVASLRLPLYVARTDLKSKTGLTYKQIGKGVYNCPFALFNVWTLPLVKPARWVLT